MKQPCHYFRPATVRERLSRTFRAATVRERLNWLFHDRPLTGLEAQTKSELVAAVHRL